MKLFKVADTYCKTGSWKIIALLKFCLFAMGIMVGMQIPSDKKKTVFRASLFIFIATYIPLMRKFIRLWITSEKEE